MAKKVKLEIELVDQFFDEVDTNKIKDYIYPDDSSFNIRTFLLRDDYVYADKVVCLIEYDSSEEKIETIDLCGVSAETVNDVFKF